jgi:hypothetical protein
LSKKLNIGYKKYSEPIVSTIPEFKKKKEKPPRTLLLLSKIKYPLNFGRKINKQINLLLVHNDKKQEFVTTGPIPHIH